MAGIGWDTQAGIEGGAAGASTGNPYAAAAMFVIGGVLGGMKKKRAERRLKEAKRLYNAAMSPEYLAKLTGKNLPLMRQQISKGGAAGIQSGIANTIASRGLTGTGTGVALKNMAQTAPEIAAFNNALDQASMQQRSKMALYGGQLGIAQNAMNPPNGFTPGYGNAMAGLYGIGSEIYGRYQAAKTGQAAQDMYGGPAVTQSGASMADSSSLYPTKNPYLANIY
jgi:hypothetical protein